MRPFMRWAAASITLFGILNPKIATSEEKNAPAMAAADAKSALIELIENSSDSDMKGFLPGLKKSDSKEVENGIIMLDLWRCDLKKETFVLAAFSKIGTLEYVGHFEKSGKKWKAKIDEERRSREK